MSEQALPDWVEVSVRLCATVARRGAARHRLAARYTPLVRGATLPLTALTRRTGRTFR